MPANWGKNLPPDPEWDDAALAGCHSWLAGWRQTNGQHARPPKDRKVIAAVGRDAIGLMHEGVHRIEICRLMWAAGRDGTPLEVTA